MEDLWGFCKEGLRCSNSSVIHILKQQAELLTEKTDGVLCGKISNRLLEDEWMEHRKEYNLETVLEVVVPSLDGYQCALFYVYSNVEKVYPARLSLLKLSKEKLEEPSRPCNRKLTANRETEFVDILKELLHSPEVNDTIKTLYQKAVLDS